MDTDPSPSGFSAAKIAQGLMFLIIADVVAGLNFLILLGENANTFLLLIGSVLAFCGLTIVRSAFVKQGENQMPAFPEVISKQAPVSKQIEPLPVDTPLSMQPARAPVKRVAAVKKKAPEPSWTETINWEEWVGKKLLQKAGIVIILIGMLVFLKYSFDNKWIDELGRVAFSTIVAVALLVAGEVFHGKYARWSHAFTGGALALLYFTVWAAHVLYASVLAMKYGITIPASMALVLYSIITVIGVLASVRYNAKTIAWFTVAGGYLTPFLIDAPDGSQLSLILYLAVLAGGMTLLAFKKHWRYMDTVAFGLTQIYLFGIVYPAPKEFLPDMSQAITAAGFFGLFTLLPLIRQFRIKQLVNDEDVGLIIANGATVFLAVVDAVGGWQSGYVGTICLALALFYLVCSAAALKKRPEDDRLVNMYLVGMILLIAGALLAEMKQEWVAAGWAPLSVLVMMMAVRVQRRGPWICAILLLIGSLVFLTLNLSTTNTLKHSAVALLTSNWSLQSYVVFLSTIFWLLLSKLLPEQLITTTRLQFKNYLHGILAVLLFVNVTIVTSQLDFTPNMLWTLGYILFTIVAMGVFFFTESLVWFAAACIVQFLSLAFIFGLADGSGMRVPDHHTQAFLMHPWSYVSVLALLTSFFMLYIADVKKDRMAEGIKVRSLLIGIALAQVWVHVSVEITNASDVFGWSKLTWQHALSVWWVFFALCMMGSGMMWKSQMVRKIGLGLLAIPFLFGHLAIMNSGGDHLIDSMVWTVLALVISIIGARSTYREFLWGGMVLLAATAGIDMLLHMGVQAGFLRSSWWALTGLITMVAGFMEREALLRRLAIGIFAATVIKLLLVDFSVLIVPVRIGASIATGLLLIAASYLYQRFDAQLASSKNS